MRATVREGPARSEAELPYCANRWNISCVSRDLGLISLVQPNEGLLVPTRIKLSTQHLNASCGLHRYGCTPWVPSGDTADVYVGNVEAATVMVQHAVSRAGATARYGSAIVGSFAPDRPVPTLSGSTSTITVSKWCGCEEVDLPNQPAPAGATCAALNCTDVGDLFSVDDLLGVIGVSLSDPAAKSVLQTLRYSGLTVRLSVRYDGATSYSYHAAANEIEAKLQSVDMLNETTRVVHDTHGLQILFAQGQGFYQLDFRTILLTLVSGLALLSVAKTIADSFLLYIAPRRADYRLFASVTTPDFAPDTTDARKVLEHVIARKRRKHLYVVGRGAGISEGLLPSEHARPMAGEAPQLIAGDGPHGAVP